VVVLFWETFHPLRSCHTRRHSLVRVRGARSAEGPFPLFLLSMVSRQSLVSPRVAFPSPLSPSAPSCTTWRYAVTGLFRRQMILFFSVSFLLVPGFRYGWKPGRLWQDPLEETHSSPPTSILSSPLETLSPPTRFFFCEKHFFLRHVSGPMRLISPAFFLPVAVGYRPLNCTSFLPAKIAQRFLRLLRRFSRRMSSLPSTVIGSPPLCGPQVHVSTGEACSFICGPPPTSSARGIITTSVFFSREAFFANHPHHPPFSKGKV